MDLSGALAVSLALFAVGLACALARRSLLHLLTGLAFVLEAAVLAFTAFARFRAEAEDGRAAAVLALAALAAETAFALALAVKLGRAAPGTLDRLRE